MSRRTKLFLVADRRGTAAIEYAIILPVLLLLVFGIIDIGRLMWTYTTVVRASQAAARCYALEASGCTTAAEAQTYAVSQAWGLNVAPSVFTVATQACGVQVSANYSFQFIVPWLDPVPPFADSNILALTTTVCYPS